MLKHSLLKLAGTAFMMSAMALMSLTTLAAPEMTTAENLEMATKLAITLIASSTNIDPADVKVVTAEHITWPDGTLGCSRSGVASTQALVDGYRIELAVDGRKTYSFHGRVGGSVFLCSRPTPPDGASR